MRQAAALAQPVVTISVDCEEEEISEETMEEVTMEDMEIMRDKEDPCNCTWTMYTDAGLGKSTVSFNLEQEVRILSIRSSFKQLNNIVHIFQTSG